MIIPSSRPTVDVAEQQWATLSFVPEDLGWFDWIIRQIEGYPVPAELAGAPTRFGFDLPAKVTLFPDRWNPLNFESYESALETSRFLVVVVSPNSAESSWVEDQMQTFRRCGGEERIVALVVDGRPDGGGGTGSSDWLPNWLARRIGENGFAPAGSSEPVVIDARGAGEKLERAREALLASLLTTTSQELERMGGLAPPLDLLPPSPQPVAPTPKPEVQFATTVPDPPRYSRKMISIAAFAALFLFGSGWLLGRATVPTPAPAPVDVSHKRRPTTESAAATPGTAQIASGEPEPVRDTTPIANAAEIVALPSPVSESPVVAPTPGPASAAASTPAVVPSPKPGASASANPDSPMQSAPPSANAVEKINLPTPVPPPPTAAPAPTPNNAPPSKPVASTSPNPASSLVRSAAPIATAAETVALPLPVPARPVPVPAPAPPSAPAIGPTLDPLALASLSPAPSSPLARAPALPVIGGEQNAPAEQTEREQIQREQRRRDDEALRAQWLSQVAAADMALRKGKMMQATDFYSAAIATAERYAARRSDDVSSLTEMAKLCRKLGAMQLQTASVGEARATFERGRRFLALLKSSAHLTPAHTQILQELETGLQALPRD